MKLLDGIWAALRDRRPSADVLFILATFLASRVILVGVALLSRAILAPGPLWQRGELVGALTSGDAQLHIAAARSGDWFGSSGAAAELGFFPLFPILLRAASLPFGHPELAGIVIANLSLLIATFWLYRLVQMESGESKIAQLAITFLLFGPASFFFSCALPESLALMLAIGSLLAARRGAWGWAAVASLCLAATVSLGAWIVVPLALEYFSQSRQSGASEKTSRSAAPLALVAVPLYLLVLALTGYAKHQEAFGLLPLARDSERTFNSLLGLSVTFESYRPVFEWLFLAVVITAATVWAIGFRLKLRWSYLAFAGLLLAACIWSHDLEAARTLGLAFPLTIALALAVHRWDWSFEVALTSATMLFVLCTMAAANGFWLT